MARTDKACAVAAGGPDGLPDPLEFFANQGLRLQGHGKWRSTDCRFHDGANALRVHVERGAYLCVSCGVQGDGLATYQTAIARHKEAAT